MSACMHSCIGYMPVGHNNSKIELKCISGKIELKCTDVLKLLVMVNQSCSRQCLNLCCDKKKVRG
jgi:hypothetical protein